MNYIKPTWNDIETSCNEMLISMSSNKYKPDAIVCLLRGGMVPARIFADRFNITSNLFVIDVKFYTGIAETRTEPIIKCSEEIIGQNVLVVDDICDSGKTMDCVKLFLRDNAMRTATLFCKEDCTTKPDFYHKVVKKDDWVMFPWEREEFGKEMLKFV